MKDVVSGLRERILFRVTQQDLGYATPCWVSNRAANIWGYTSLRVDSVQTSTHRAAYEAFVGPIPEGMMLDHLCHDGRVCDGNASCPHRRCCNPGHLEPVDAMENAARSRNSLKTACKHGHEFTPDNTRVMKNGHRACRRCAVIASQKYQRKRAGKRTSDHHPVVVTLG